MTRLSMSLEEYPRFEEHSPQRRELVGGLVYEAMSGGTEAHDLVAAVRGRRLLGVEVASPSTGWDCYRDDGGVGGVRPRS